MAQPQHPRTGVTQHGTVHGCPQLAAPVMPPFPNKLYLFPPPPLRELEPPWRHSFEAIKRYFEVFCLNQNSVGLDVKCFVYFFVFAWI